MEAALEAAAKAAIEDNDLALAETLLTLLKRRWEEALAFRLTGKTLR